MSSYIAADMSRFTSRFDYAGTLTFTTAHRIGAAASADPTEPNLPLLRTADGRPYIPGSSFKGALRSYTEAVLRTFDTALACNPLIDDERCLDKKQVRTIKQDPALTDVQKDQKLRDDSCLVCKVFGNSVIAAKVLIKDLMVVPESFHRVQVRDGVAIDRDTLAVGHGPFQFETVPAGARFELTIAAENVDPGELGLLMIGLEAFRRGDIQLGGIKSRGLGWCELEHNWQQCAYADGDSLLDYLLGSGSSTQLDDITGPAHQAAWLQAIGQRIRGEEDA